MRDRRRLHNKTFSRAVSLLLGLLLCLEPLSMVALAVMGGDAPAAKTTYKPIVVVEGNAVVTGVEEGADPTAEDLTGFFEVALKVQTAAYYDDNTGQQVSYEKYAEDQADIADAFAANGTILTPTIIKVDDIDFGTVAATLKYDADIFTPVSWSATEDIFDANGDVLSNAAGLTDINALTTDGFASLDAIGPEEMLQSDAVITKSTDNTNSANEYVLTLSAWARRENVRYDQPTTVVVVRFAYNKNLRPMLTTDDDSGEYVLGAADFTGITMTGGWNEGGTAVSTKPERPVLWLATKDEAVESHHGQSVWYDGNYYESGTLTTRETAYYYYIEAEGSNPTNGSDNVPYIDKNGVAQTAPNVAIPNTEGAKVLSLDYGTTGATPNYLDNVLKQYDTYPSLVFDFVNAASFLTSGVNVDDVAPILFYDWDDTLLGVLVVEKGKDVRAEVNEFVSQWVHPDIIKENYAVSSLTRAANYRGKYDFNGPTTDPGNADTKPYTEGAEEYPLTNKLDYVFFKRPMEFVDTDIDTDTEADTWQQKDADSDNKGDWDPDYPYVYGWASCVDEKLNPDPTMVEATWTTLGMGELSGYNGASLGGYEPIGTDPATFTYDSEEVTFTFADFEAGVDGPTYVKAVYEPGVDLMTMYYTYRMVDKPYYNKLNGVPAQTGGVYSVDITFERSNEDAAGVRGVARIREPVVRQNTTTDVKWEEEDLISASANEAYYTREKTTYTKIDVENTEQISFTLALSGRYNHVDYYLAENYGSNFVSGGARTSPNVNYRTGDTSYFAIDNYNYMADDSITSDVYYDAAHEYREGTHGFVLYGTLNNLMEHATQKVLEPAHMLTQYVSEVVLIDANIRLADGTAPSTNVQINNMINLLVEAAAAAKAAHDGGNDAYWNTEKDCAQLTYHQLQGFIITSAAGAATLNHSEAPVAGLTWCHLHAECAADLVNKPETWEELIQAVMDDTAADLLLFPELEALAGLRRDADGTKYLDSATLIADIKAAVDRMAELAPGTAVTWDRVQGYILKRDIGSPEDAEQISYDTAWWYDGGTKPTDLASVLAAALYASPTDPTVPVRNAKLNTLKDAFDQVTDPDDPDNTAWSNRTDNFMGGQEDATTDAGDSYSAVKFFEADADTGADAFEVFTTRLKNAVQGLGTANTETNWRRIQYYLIHGDHYTSAADPDAAEAEMASYWWYKNNKLIVDVQTMLEAAATNSAAWQSFTADDLYALKGLSFSADFAGTRWDGTNIDTFKSIVKQIATTGTGQTWYQVQYRIIHWAESTSSVDPDVALKEGEAYYWWKGGKTEAPTLTHNTDDVDHDSAASATANTLVEMAFRIKYNGIPDPRNASASASTNHGLTNAVLDAYRLQKKRPESTDADYTVNLFKATDSTDSTDPTNSIDVTTLLNLLDTLLENAEDAGNGSQYAPPTLNWFQIQYALLNGGAYLAAPEDGMANWSGYDDNAYYWWRLRDNNPNNANTVTKFQKFLGYLYQLGKSQVDGDGSYDLTTAHQADYGADMSFQDFLLEPEMSIYRSVRKQTYTSGTTYTRMLDAMKTYAATLYRETYAGVVDHDKGTFNLTWAQVQYAMLYSSRGQWITAADAAVDAVNQGYSAWDPTGGAASSASVMSLRPAVPEDQYTSETTVSEDGLTTTLVETLGTWNNELGDYDWTVTTTVTQQVGEATVTTITVTTMTYDPETWQPIFDTTTETRVTDSEAGDVTYGLEEDTDLTPVQPSDEADDQTPEDSAADAEDEAQTSNGGDQTYQAGDDTQTTPVETAGDTAAAESETAAESDGDSETGAVSAASAGLLSLAWRTDGTGPGISLTPAGPVSTLRVTGILDTGQLFGSQRDGPLGIIPSRSNLPTAAALLAHRRIRT